MHLLLAAMIGGAVGSGARYLVYLGCARCLAPGFPWATLTVNVVGSFAMGVVVTLVQSLLDGSPLVRTFLATGILGGFTTFSAFSLDAVELFDKREPLLGVAYVAASVGLSIAALMAGLLITKASLK